MVSFYFYFLQFLPQINALIKCPKQLSWKSQLTSSSYPLSFPVLSVFIWFQVFSSSLLLQFVWISSPTSYHVLVSQPTLLRTVVTGKNAAKQDGVFVMSHSTMTIGSKCFLKGILKVMMFQKQPMCGCFPCYTVTDCTGNWDVQPRVESLAL